MYWEKDFFLCIFVATLASSKYVYSKSLQKRQSSDLLSQCLLELLDSCGFYQSQQPCRDAEILAPVLELY